MRCAQWGFWSYSEADTEEGPIVFTYVLFCVRLIKYISAYICNIIKKTAVKPPTERSEVNKVPSEARLIKYIFFENLATGSRAKLG